MTFVDAVAWLIVKAALAFGAVCGLAAAAGETARILRDLAETEDVTP